MDKSILPKTSNFKEAVAMMNNVEPNKFPLLLTRIIKVLHNKQVQPFSDEELSQLESVLDVSVNDIKNVIDSCSFIFEQSAYFNLKSSDLGDQLKMTELEENKIGAFEEIWEVDGGNYIAQIKETGVTPYSAEGLRFQLHLQMAQSSMSRLKDPLALFEISLNTDDVNKVIHSSVQQHIHIYTDIYTWIYLHHHHQLI
eukprot:TRINITY_DN2126_c0_g1_i1.p1 TRINITY_DN2126_c0_g1~~TRINITY_DN2126_c0_g1_i1.p1  ORF type:complete len:198 (+),score=41.13 TRINITY_DN2126_c0_g1_i1:46-639(+)